MNGYEAFLLTLLFLFLLAIVGIRAGFRSRKKMNKSVDNAIQGIDKATEAIDKNRLKIEQSGNRMEEHSKQFLISSNQRLRQFIEELEEDLASNNIPRRDRPALRKLIKELKDDAEKRERMLDEDWS